MAVGYARLFTATGDIRSIHAQVKSSDGGRFKSEAGPHGPRRPEWTNEPRDANKVRATYYITQRTCSMTLPINAFSKPTDGRYDGFLG